MYTRISRSGGRAYLQLVEAYRNADGKPRQRLVANLGRLDALSEKELAPLIAGLQRAAGRDPAAKPDAVTFEAAKAFGDLYALHALWSELGLERALARALRSSRRSIDAPALIRTMVFNRLCAPDSKLGVLRWLDTVCMPDIPSDIRHDHLLRSMDALMDNIGAVERAVAGALRPLLNDALSVVFYDLTTIRISGTGKVADDLRAFGKSKETGGIARQFVLGVIQTAEGLPIAHEVHAGNVGEARTLLPMIEAACARYQLNRVIVVADRGLLNLDNLKDVEALRGANGQPIEYILAVPARRYGEFAEIVSGEVLETLNQDGRAQAHWQERRLVIDHNAERAAAQTASRQAEIDRIVAEGERMATRLDSAEAGAPQRGRASTDRKTYLRFATLVKDAHLSKIIKADLEADRFSFAVATEAQQAAERLDGKLLLVTNTALPVAEVIDRYRALADIERGFRVLKSDIEIAPVHHRLPERIRAHALICFLALVLYRVLRERLRARRPGVSPRRALALLRQIQEHHITVGGRQLTGTSRVQPEQRDLFNALNLPVPDAPAVR